jgi:hypothetical protein
MTIIQIILLLNALVQICSGLARLVATLRNLRRRR